MQYTTIDHIFNKWYLILDIWIFTSPLRMREDLGERAKFSIVQLWSCVKVEVGSSWAPVRNKPTVYVDVKQHSTNQLSTLVAAQWRGDTALTFSLLFWRRSTASLVFRAGAPPTTTRHTTTHAQWHTHTHGTTTHAQTHTHTRHTTWHNFLWISQWFCDPQYYLTRLTSHSIYNTNSKRKIQTHKRFKRTLIYSDTNPHSPHFRGNPLCQDAEWHLTIKRWKTIKNVMRSDWNNIVYRFWLSSVVFLSSAWKITPKMCRLCVLINKRCLEPFMCLDLALER